MISIETIPGIRGGVMTESSKGDEFKYDIFDTLQELLQILQCTPTHYFCC
jgi:hypothetical protein